MYRTFLEFHADQMAKIENIVPNNTSLQKPFISGCNARLEVRPTKNALTPLILIHSLVPK